MRLGFGLGVTLPCLPPIVPTPGQIASAVLRFGRQTRAGMGAVPLAAASLGVLTSGTVSAWQLVRQSGDATTWPATVSNGETPAPSRTLTEADAGTQAVYAIIADGVATGRTITINVQTIAESSPALTVSKGSEIDGAGGLRGTIKNDLGGKTIELQRGSDAQWANPDNVTTGAFACYWRGFNGHTGRFKITSSDPTAKPVVGRMHLVGCANIDIEGLTFAHSVAAGAGSNAQGVAMFFAGYSASFGGCSGLGIRNNTFGTTSATPNDPTTWKTALVLNGETDALTNPVTGCVVEDCSFTRVKDGYGCYNATSCTFQRLTVDRFCSNASFCGGSQLVDITQQDCVHMRPFTNPIDTGDHPDMSQWGTTKPMADYQRIIVRRNSLLTLDGDNLAQGTFFNDVASNGTANATGATLSNGQRLTGFKFVDCVAENLFYEGGSALGLTLDTGTGWTVRNITCVRGKLPGIPAGTTRYDPKLRNDRLTDSSSNIYEAIGTAVGVVTHTFSGALGLTKTNCREMPATGISATGNDEAARIAFYQAQGFQDPGNADPRIGFRPIANGADFIAAGRYRGAFNPDGSWADARAAAQSADIVMPADVWAFGASSMQGGQSFANASSATSTEDALTQVVRAIEKLPDGDTSYTTVSGTKTHVSPNPPIEYNLTGVNAARKIRNHGVSGQTSGSGGTIASNMAGKTGLFGANDLIILHQGDNGISAGSPANTPEFLAGGYAALRTSAGARPFVEVVNTQGSFNTAAGTAAAEPAGSFFAYLKAASLRTQMDLFPGKVFSFHEVLMSSPSTGTNDDTDLGTGVAPRSYYTNDGSHQFDPGYKRQGDTIFKPLIDAWAGGTPFALPQVIEAATPASPAAGDVIGSVVAYGTGGSWALDSTNTQTAYAINAAGQVSRVGATPPARDVTWAILKASKSGRFDKVSQRIGIAERAASGVSKLVEFDGYSIIGMPDTKLINGAKATILFRLQSVDASVQQTIMGLLGSTGLNVRTNTTGNLDIVWKNSANATVFSKTTTGGLFTTGNTVRWVAVCIDLSNAAAEVTKLVTWTTSGATPTVDSALAAALSDTTTQHVLKMDSPLILGNNTISGSAASTWSKFRMGDLNLWTDFVDFEVLANRQAVCDAAGLPLSAWVSGDGTVDGKTPVIRKKGNAADWRFAREQGSLKPATPGASGQYWGFNNRRRPDGEFGYLTTVT